MSQQYPPNNRPNPQPNYPPNNRPNPQPNYPPNPRPNYPPNYPSPSVKQPVKQSKKPLVLGIIGIISLAVVACIVLVVLNPSTPPTKTIDYDKVRELSLSYNHNFGQYDKFTFTCDGNIYDENTRPVYSIALFKIQNLQKFKTVESIIKNNKLFEAGNFISPTRNGGYNLYTISITKYSGNIIIDYSGKSDFTKPGYSELDTAIRNLVDEVPIGATGERLSNMARSYDCII